MATGDDASSGEEGQSAAKPVKRPRKLPLNMRWKMLAGFSLAFTVVFIFIALWVINHSSATAMERLTGELHSAAYGGAETLDERVFEALVTTVPPVPDPSNPTGLGYPDNPLYTTIARELMRIRHIVPEALPYTYFREPKDDQLYYAASAGYLLTPPFGATYKVPVASVSQQSTYDRMRRGLTSTTDEPPYTDSYGSWISSYSPILDADGEVVGAIGIDYPTSYVDQTQRAAIGALVPALVASYLSLLVLVLIVSSALVRPVRRLTTATRRIADGEYDLDPRSLVRTRFPDEIYELGQSFEVMARKVGERERSLTFEVQRLRVEIDETKRKQTVDELAGTDFFEDLVKKSADLRARLHEQDPPADDQA
ncbi:MAG: HAMP domain-containing protein [Actinomycetes bacterium]